MVEWQTRHSQKVMSESSCGFESHLGHMDTIYDVALDKPGQVDLSERIYTKRNYYDSNEENCDSANEDRTSWWHFEGGVLVYGTRPDLCWIRQRLPAGCSLVD